MAESTPNLLTLLHSLPWDLNRGEERLEEFYKAVCVKKTRTRQVLMVERCGGPQQFSPLPESAICFFAKRYLHANRWYRRFTWRIGMSKADREARLHEELAELSLLVPKVLGTAADSEASYLITRELPFLITMGQALSLAPMESRHVLWMLAGNYLKSVWDLGVFHPDLLEEHLCLTTFVGLDPHDGRNEPADTRKQNYWLKKLKKLPHDPIEAATLVSPNLYESQQLSPAASAFSLCLIDVDGSQIHGTGQQVPMHQRYFNAMQQLRSLSPDLGGAPERCLFLERSFEEHFLKNPEKIWQSIEAQARNEKSTTNISLTREDVMDYATKRKRAKTLEGYLRKYFD